MFMRHVSFECPLFHPIFASKERKTAHFDWDACELNMFLKRTPLFPMEECPWGLLRVVPGIPRSNQIRRPLPTAGGARQRRDSKQWGPWPAGPVRPSGPCCFAVARAPFVSFVGGWKTATASFLVGSESNVRYWGAFPAGPVRPSGPCCFAVARAPFVSLVGGWKTASFLRCGEGAVREPCWRLEDS